MSSTPASRASRSRRLARAAAVTLALACVAFPAAALAAAQAPPSERGAPSLALTVTQLSGMVTPEADLRLRVRVANASRQDREDLRLLVTVHRPPVGRFYFQQAMDGGELGGVIHGFSQDVETVPARGSRSVELTQSADEIGLARSAGQENVYPLRLQLLSAGEVVDEATTNLVYTDAAVALPIAVSLLLPMAAPPSRDGQGVFIDHALPEALGTDGPLGGVARALAERDRLPVTLAVDALTLEEAADLSTGFLLADGQRPVTRRPDSVEAERATTFLQDVREIVQRPTAHLLAQPYASADLVALERHGLASEAARHVSDGGRAAEALVGDRPIDTILWPPAGIDRDLLVRLRGLGVRNLVLAERYLRLPGPRGRLSPSPVRRVRAAPGTTMQVLVPDPWLEQTLAESSLDPPLLAQRLLGEIATVYFEAPGTEDRGVLIAPPWGTEVQPKVLAGLADGLADAPFADVVALTTLLRRVEPGEETVGLEYPAEARMAELPASYVAELERARRALGSLDGVLVDDRATPARFDRLLLQAASVQYRDDQSAGRALLSTVTRTVEELYGSIDVPDVPPVTLTSVEGQLPVTVRSTAAVPLRVLLHLRTATYEIEGGPTRELVLEPDSAEILTFQVRALRPGRTDGVQVLVTDVDGVVELAAGTVVVRSTAFSVVGLIVTGGAALFLLGWAARATATRRRSQQRRQQPRRPARRAARSAARGQAATEPADALRSRGRGP